MPRTIRYTLLSLRELIVSAGPFILLAVGLLALAYWWLDPIPPKQVRLATGPAQSAYAEFGTRYQKALAASGIEVVLLPSEGSSDNLRMVQEGRADLGFVQGGSRKPESFQTGLRFVEIGIPNGCARFLVSDAMRISGEGR